MAIKEIFQNSVLRKTTKCTEIKIFKNAREEAQIT